MSKPDNAYRAWVQQQPGVTFRCLLFRMHELFLEQPYSVHRLPYLPEFEEIYRQLCQEGYQREGVLPHRQRLWELLNQAQNISGWCHKDNHKKAVLKRCPYWDAFPAAFCKLLREFLIVEYHLNHMPINRVPWSKDWPHLYQAACIWLQRHTQEHKHPSGQAPSEDDVWTLLKNAGRKSKKSGLDRLGPRARGVNRSGGLHNF